MILEKGHLRTKPGHLNNSSSITSIGIRMVKTGAQCRVCTSPNFHYYEKVYYEAQGRISYPRLVKLAMDKGESISRKSFERHFKKHYMPETVQELLDKGKIDNQMEKARVETIDILDEIKKNLQGLKDLIGQTKHTKNLGDIVAIYREHRLTLQDIDKLRSKLTASSTMTQAELFKEMAWAASILCPECRKNFWVKLDERLKKRGFS